MTTSTGVTVAAVGATTLNITAPDKAVLSWVNFGGGADTIAAGDTLTYTLPSAAGSVLNLVTGALTTTIDGSIVSNGNVYVMNKNGIVIGSTATINAGGFYASAIDEPLAAANFAFSGSLTYNGTSGGAVLVNGASLAPATLGQKAQIQAVGTGNNIVLAGNTVTVNAGNFYGNLTARTIGGNIALAQGGPVAINQVSGSGGNLTLTSNGGAVALTGTGVTGTGPTPAGATPGVALSLVNPVFPTGSGYTPNSTISLTVTAPTILQSTAATNTSTTSVGTGATATATIDAAGQISGYTLTSAGSGYTAAPTITVPAPTGSTTTVAGNLTINTAGATTNGAVTSTDMASANSVSITTAGSSTAAAGDVTLPNVQFTTLTMPSVGTVSVSDTSGGLALGNSKITPNANNALTLTASNATGQTNSSITMASGARVEVVPTTAFPTPNIRLTASNGSVTYTGIGALSIGTLSVSAVSGTATINGNSDITVPNFAGRNLVVTTTGGILTAGNLTNSSGSATLTSTGNLTVGTFFTSGTVKAISSAGTLTAGTAATNANAAGGSSEFRGAGDVLIGSLAATSGATVASTGGSVTITNGFAGNGSITAATDVNIGLATPANAKAALSSSASVIVPTSASGGRVTGGSVNNNGALAGLGYAPNSTVAITFAAAPGGGTTATGYANTNANGQISGIVVTNPGAGYTAAPAITITGAPVNAVSANGALNITATNGSVAISAPISSTSTSALSISSAQSLAVPATTAPTLNLTSTGGSITQTAAITSTGTATISAAADAILNTNTNDFGTVVVKATPMGATINDANAVILGNGTDAKGNVTINAGQGLVGGVVNGGALTVTAPTYTGPSALASTTSGTNGTVSSVTVTAGGGGYAANLTNVPVVFTAPPANSTPAAIAVASGAQTAQGYVLSAGTLASVILPSPVGNGYQPGTEVAMTVTDATPGAVAPTGWVGVVNGNGQIASIKPGAAATVGSGLAAPSIAFPAPTVVPSTATGYATTNANGVISSVVVTDAGNGYFGGYVPRVTITPVSIAAAATATAVSNAANAVTGVTVAGGNAGYSVAPVITGGGLTYDVTLTNGSITAITPRASGGVSIGAAASDVIKVGGELAITTAGPAGTVAAPAPGAGNYSEVTTVANNVSVFGKVTMNTTGANATLGTPIPLGGSTALYFGNINGNVGTGTLTAYENTTLNLGSITAANVVATSHGSDIINTGALTVTGTVTASANSFFNPGSVTLESSNNNVANFVIANASTAAVRSTVNTTLTSSASATGRGIVGAAKATASAGRNITFNTAGGGDFSKVGFNVSGAGNVTVTDLNGVELENAVSAGTGTVTVNSAGPLVLGSGIALASTGAVTLNSTGTSANITDKATAFIFGPVTFNSDNGISVTQSGHGFGPVTLNSGIGGAAATTGNIAFTESGTLNLRGVSVNALVPGQLGGSVVLTSTTGDIIQTGAGSIVLPTLVAGAGTTALAQTASFNAAGAVNLSNPGANNITAPIVVSASTDSTIAQKNNIVLGNVAVRNGKLSVTSAGSVVAGGTISQLAGSKVNVYGDTSFNTTGSTITVTNTGNTFGGLTLNSVNTALAGADIALTESSTMRLMAIDTGTAGKLTLASEAGSIIGGTAPTVVVGGAASLTAPTGITLNDGNQFKSTLLLNTGASATLQNAVNTTLASGTTVGGSLSLRTNGSNVTDAAAGGLKVVGAVFIDAGAGNISITGSGNAFGAVQFRGNNVSIAEDSALNLAGGSVANGNASLSSLSDITTSGVASTVFSGTSVFNGTLALSAGGQIVAGNALFVANGLTFRALGAVDLSALSLSGNLNGRTPTNLGAASYKAPGL